MNSAMTGTDAFLASARKEWSRFLAVGVALIVLGVAAIIYDATATTVSVFVLGLIIFLAGIVQLSMAFLARGAGHVVLYLLTGALELVVGTVLMKDTSAGAEAVTLILAVYFMFGGLFRILYSLWAQFPQYGWAVFSGIVAFALGVLLWTQWPNASPWFIGFAVGLNFLLFGISWTALAMKLKPT